MKKRILTILLLLALLTSCGGTANETTQTETAPAAETETETTDPRDIPDAVPELDFGGASFRSIGQSSAKQEIYVAEETGDALNDAIYIRNRGVEERLNVTIAPMEEIWYTDLSAKILQCVTAGDDAYELILGQMEQSGKDAQEGIYRNWYDSPYMDIPNPLLTNPLPSTERCTTLSAIC